MNADFYSQMVSLRDQVADVRSEFGVPNVRSLIVVYRSTNLPLQYLEINPTPVIETVNPRMVAAFGQNLKIQLELDDLQVSEISRRYTREQILGSYYIVDGALTPHGVEGGFEAERVPGMALVEKALTWNLVLRRRKNTRS